MRLYDQTLVEFAILTRSGIAVSAVATLLLTDYRGFLTRYAHGCWQVYQRRWYQRLFVWTSWFRAYYACEARVRGGIRLVGVPGLATGVLVLSIEFAALATGHVI